MKKISILLTLTILSCIAITNPLAAMSDSYDVQSTWQRIKEFENSLKHEVFRFTITSTWPEYHSNSIRKEDLFNALIYAENTCECKNDLTLTLDCQKELLKPLLLAYIEITLKNEELAPRDYFEPHNREKHREYIDYLKEQKKHYIDIEDEQPIREY